MTLLLRKKSPILFILPFQFPPFLIPRIYYDKNVRRKAKLNTGNRNFRVIISTCEDRPTFTHTSRTTGRLQETEGLRYEKFPRPFLTILSSPRYRHLSSAAKRKQRGSKEKKKEKKKEREDRRRGSRAALEINESRCSRTLN